MHSPSFEYGLSRERSKETSGSERLDRILRSVAERVNEALGYSLVGPEGRIESAAYRTASGGPYKKENIKGNEKLVHQHELGWSGVTDERIRAHLLKEYGITQSPNNDEQTETLLVEWNRRRERHEGPLAERAVTATLARLLGSDYLVVRSAKYDDYEHGVDQLIVDRETGDVVCAFDEVTDGAGGSRTEKKDARIRTIAQRGGVRLRYGLAVRQGNVERAPVEHVPLFRLALTRGELHKLIDDLGASLDDEPTETERAVFGHMLDSLDEQSTALLQESIPEVMRTNLVRFRASLGRMRERAPVQLAA